MALDAKQSFLSQVEHRCEDRLTVTELSGLMSVISDVLQSFRMEELKLGGVGSERRPAGVVCGVHAGAGPERKDDRAVCVHH